MADKTTPETINEAVKALLGAMQSPSLRDQATITIQMHGTDEDREDLDRRIKAAIKTAATVNLGMGSDAQWRTVDILSDATLALLRRDPRACTFRAWLDEQVLAEEGVTDFTKYRCVPDVEPPPISIELVDPGWGARNGGRA